MKRHRLNLPARLFFLAGLFSLGLLGCHKPPAPEEEAEAVVKAVPAKRESLGEYTELLGATQTLPQHAARVTAPVEGHVLWALSDGSGKAIIEGQQVDKGQVILQLDDRIIRSTRDKTQAMLEDLQAQKRQADIALQLAQLERDRLEKLLPGGTGSIPLVSQVELEKASLLTKDAESKQKAVLAKEARFTRRLGGVRYSDRVSQAPRPHRRTTRNGTGRARTDAAHRHVGRRGSRSQGD